VEIYRLVCEDTVEEKIYHRQVFKKYMADRVLADPGKRKLFEKESLHDLFTVPERVKSEVKSVDSLNVVKITKKVIKKDEKLQIYCAEQERKLK